MFFDKYFRQIYKHRICPIGIYRFQCKSADRSPSQLSDKPSNTPHPPKDPPEEGYDPECVEHYGFHVPEFIKPAAFRKFAEPFEVLGPDAGKKKDYKNAEYFGYHRYSFVELQNGALKLRDERRESGGVQIQTEVDEEGEESDEEFEEVVGKDGKKIVRGPPAGKLADKKEIAAAKGKAGQKVDGKTKDLVKKETEDKSKIPKIVDKCVQILMQDKTISDIETKSLEKCIELLEKAKERTNQEKEKTEGKSAAKAGEKPEEKSEDEKGERKQEKESKVKAKPAEEKSAIEEAELEAECKELEKKLKKAKLEAECKELEKKLKQAKLEAECKKLEKKLKQAKIEAECKELKENKKKAETEDECKELDENKKKAKESDDCKEEQIKLHLIVCYEDEKSEDKSRDSDDKKRGKNDKSKPKNLEECDENKED